MMKNYIVVHHSLTKDAETVSWGAIRNYHTKTLGWEEIGYHAGLELIGDTYEILLGRLPNVVGAHCKDAMMNQRGIGVCVVGNFDLFPPPVEAWNKLKPLLEWLMEIYWIPAP